MSVLWRFSTTRPLALRCSLFRSYSGSCRNNLLFLLSLLLLFNNRPNLNILLFRIRKIDHILWSQTGHNKAPMWTKKSCCILMDSVPRHRQTNIIYGVSVYVLETCGLTKSTYCYYLWSKSRKSLSSWEAGEQNQKTYICWIIFYRHEQCTEKKTALNSSVKYRSFLFCISFKSQENHVNVLLLLRMDLKLRNFRSPTT